MSRFRPFPNSVWRKYGTTAVIASFLGVTFGSECNMKNVISTIGRTPYSYCFGTANGQGMMYTPEEVEQMDGTNGKPFWVTYRGEVFDLTTFKAAHPGGKMIEQAAGRDVESFWRKWAYHFQSDRVKSTLLDNKVGNLSECHLYGDNDEYAQDPERGPQHLHHDFIMTTPPDTQTHAHILKRHFLTPNEALYIRNHAPVPSHLSAASHDVSFSLSSDGGESRDVKKKISLAELRERFGTSDIISVLQCSGNRQIDDYKKLGANGFTGTPSMAVKSGMMGNVLWSGVRLDTVLRALYPEECQEEASAPGSWHVIFTGADEYESSTPLSLVLRAATDGLLAFDMNGAALLPDHGYPLRVVLPGLAGARSVKWVEGVTLSRSPSSQPWNAYYYRDSKREDIQALPLNSVILSPDKRDVVQLREDGSGSVSVQGVAYSGGENTSIVRVEVTADGGQSWTRARLLTEEKEAVPQDTVGDHSWVRFVAEVPVSMGGTSGVCGRDDPSHPLQYCHEFSIHSRAIDSAGLVQPEVSNPEQRTYLYAGWGAASVTAMSSR